MASSIDRALRHATGSAQPGAGGARRVAAAPFVDSGSRRGVQDSPGGGRHAVAGQYPGIQAPDTVARDVADSDVDSTVRGWDGDQNLEYWKLKARQVNRDVETAPAATEPSTQEPARRAPAARNTGGSAETNSSGSANRSAPGNNTNDSGGYTGAGGHSGGTTDGSAGSDHASAVR